MIQYEKEVCEYLSLPSIPKKEWNGETSFDKGVAVLKHRFCDQKFYGICSFNADTDSEPLVQKVFSCEPFATIDKIFVVPNYMDTNVNNADLDDESKKKAEELANEAKSLENDNNEYGTQTVPEKEYFFDHINNDEEAVAFITAYNKENKIPGAIPKNHDTIVMRLNVIYADLQKLAPNNDDIISCQTASVTIGPANDGDNNDDNVTDNVEKQEQ